MRATIDMTGGQGIAAHLVRERAAWLDMVKPSTGKSGSVQHPPGRPVSHGDVAGPDALGSERVP